MSDTNESRRKLEATLESFGVRAKVLDVVRGPAVTRYEVQPATGVKVSRIVGLTDDIALALAAKDIRMEAPIPGKSAIGIEVPNLEVSIVTMREVMETPSFLNATSSCPLLSDAIFRVKRSLATWPRCPICWLLERQDRVNRFALTALLQAFCTKQDPMK